MITPDRVLNFIEAFTDKGRKTEVIDTFTCGYCYWFAHILEHRFTTEAENIYIIYDQVMNHFGCYIDGEVYDITGLVTNKYNWESFDKLFFDDNLLYNRLLRDCVNKEPYDKD